ncbi:ras-related protein RABC2a-like isoform X1 [Gossypium australe]|uniref:Ras-related protein RABC2a-like isoform X1 n=1 Tax=Gossypium australe TaxID=47621 RepID=A0A5B6VBG2_9ROSI|nr:ras-related protein RABC2a-like isoform X1 [Gossypium australe]
MGSSSGQSSGSYDLSFKILLIGDSGVGKSSLLVSFISASAEDLAPTIGVDFKIKFLTVGGKRLKLTIWDTAGQERFRTLTSSYYRGAQGIILGEIIFMVHYYSLCLIVSLVCPVFKFHNNCLTYFSALVIVYDVTRRETFTNLSTVWAKEVELYSTNQDCVKMLVGNKVDRDSERAVSREEGMDLAKELGCMFLECSARTRKNVEQCFEELALKIMEVPSFLEEGSAIGKRNMLKHKPEYRGHQGGGCCS